jgi:hypothetical protein
MMDYDKKIDELMEKRAQLMEEVRVGTLNIQRFEGAIIQLRLLKTEEEEATNPPGDTYGTVG